MRNVKLQRLGAYSVDENVIVSLSMPEQIGFPVIYQLNVYLRHCPVLSLRRHLDHKVEEKLSNTLTLPSQHSLPIDWKLEPEWLPRA